MPIAALLVVLLWGADPAAVNLARASRISALRTADAGERDAAAERIRELLAADASRVPLYVELALLFAGRAPSEGSRWTMQARWVLARARQVAADTAAPAREHAMLENAAGVIALGEGDETSARRAFDRAAQLDPAYAPAQLNRGILAAYNHKHGVAVEALAVGLRDPAFAKDVEGAIALGVALANRGDLTRACRVLRGLVGRSDDPRAQLALGIVLMDYAGPAHERPSDERTPYQDAKLALTRYVAARPTDPELVRAAKQRIADLDELLDPGINQRRVMDQAQELERLHRAQEPAEKQRLRALEAELLREQATSR